MGGKCYVSFSGGKDSTVLLHIVRSLFPDVKGVYIDTGLEYPEIKEFVKSFSNIEIIRPKKTFIEVISEYGYPVISKEIAECIYEARKSDGNKYSYRIQRLNGTLLDKNGNLSQYNCSKYKYLLDAPFKISDKCCDVMKKRPAHLQTKMYGYPFIQTLASESRLRTTNWIIHGCNSFNSKHPSSAPMSFWTEQDVLEYIKVHNIKIASVYGNVVENDKGKLQTTGCSRTGCVFCAFGQQCEKEPNRFQRLKQTHPKLWDYCINGKLNMREVLDYIGVKYE